MRIADYPVVEALVSTRDHLIDQRDEGKIRIEINGRQQPADFVVNVTPAIKLELRHRICEVEQQLRTLGVEV